MELAKNVAIKLGLFFLVSVAFVGVLLFYSDAREDEWSSGLQDRLAGNEVFGKGVDGRRHFERSFTVEPNGEFVLTTDVGDVAIEGGEGNEVRVSVDAAGREDRLRSFDVDFKQADNRVEVRGVLKKRGWNFWDWDGLRAKFIVTVPRQFTVTCVTAGGDVYLRAVKGNASIHTSGGDVMLEELEGDTRAETSGGDVDVKNVTGTVSVESSGGDIRASGVRGDTRAETSGGDIVIRALDGRIYAETSGGDIEVTALGTNKGVNLHTSGGDIEIYLPRDIAATVDASSSGGEVTCELDIVTHGKVRDDELYGQINGGGEKIRAQTSGGDVSIREAH